MVGLRSALRVVIGVVAFCAVGFCSRAAIADSWKFEDWEYNTTQETEYKLWIYKFENGVTTKVTELNYDYVGPIYDPYGTYYEWRVNQTVIIPGNQGATWRVIGYSVNGGPWYSGGQVSGVKQ